MTKKKHTHGGAQKSSAAMQKASAQTEKSVSHLKNAPAAPPQKKSKAALFAVAAAAVVLVAVVVVAGQGGGTPGTRGQTPTAGAEESRYIGRLLPAGYKAPAVAEPVDYNSSVEMSELTATVTDTEVIVPLADVTDAKLALLQYDSAQSLPVIAYVKPSGTLFVGVSFCPPCQGEWQTIQSDGTLTCNSCGTKRDLETMVGISGSCKLYPLDEVPATVVDGNVVLDRAALDSWTPQPLDRKVG